MTAPRECGRCGARLSPNLPWCAQCFEPVRHLTPREPPLPPSPDLVPIDPSQVRRDHVWIHLDKPVYSRVRGGPTAPGLWGRVALTALVLFWLPWGPFTFVTFLYLLGYGPVAALLLAAVWRKGVVGPRSTAAIVHEARTIAGIRMVAAAVGLALAIVALASSSAIFAYAPAIAFLAAALVPPAAVGVAEAIEEAKARPLGALILLNGLNVLDLILSDAAIGAGVARELNPLVLAIGPWAKLALVAACSALLYWKRPRALVWPSLAFLVLAAYHLSGLLGGLAPAG